MHFYITNAIFVTEKILGDFIPRPPTGALPWTPLGDFHPHATCVESKKFLKLNYVISMICEICAFC